MVVLLVALKSYMSKLERPTYSKSSLSHLGFVEVPTNTCLPCGGPAKFNCSTIVNLTVFHNGMIVLELGPGGQLWRIQTTNGMTEFLYSTIPDDVSASYEFIHTEFISTGLLVHDTNSSWNGTTFQCIAYNQGNIEDLNNSSEPVTLEVGGECRI